MGTELNDIPEPENLTYLSQRYINDTAKANRRILSEYMEKG